MENNIPRNTPALLGTILSRAKQEMHRQILTHEDSAHRSNPQQFVQQI